MTAVALRRCVPLLLAGALLAAPVHAQPSITPREIAARAQRSLLVVRSVGADGDTIGSGTGFIVSSDGTFVTNYHVVEGAARLRVEFLDGRSFTDVSFVTADARRDLAVLKIPGTGHPALRLGRDSAAVIGDRVYVMGNPLGMAGTFSDGLVSGRRPVEGVSMVQISAPISPGSSGGPVMDESGEVIGVATLMLVGGQNLNLAVPARYVAPLLASRPAPRRFSAALVPRGARGGLADVDPSEPRRTPRSPRGQGTATAEWREQVISQLESTTRLVRGQGMEPAFPVRTGMARQGQIVNEEYRLTAGAKYLSTARCD
ncbi:MAG: serine protease, partial [Gemmatimonadetes bacterium]|nr:serine protease [Gemmatimonadota bacterium]